MASLRRGVIVSVIFTVFGGPGIVIVYLLLPMNGADGDLGFLPFPQKTRKGWGAQPSINGGRRKRWW
jgi:hypothetical protein